MPVHVMVLPTSAQASYALYAYACIASEEWMLHSETERNAQNQRQVQLPDQIKRFYHTICHI